MKKILVLFLAIMTLFIQLSGQQVRKTFNLGVYKPKGNGIADDSKAFQSLFLDVEKAGGGTVTIPPGDYFLKGEKSIKLTSNTTVFAYGAKFLLPKTLGDRARVVVFEGTDVANLSWFGGFFQGFCFDPSLAKNTWEPNANTRMIVINTSEKGVTDNLSFRDIQSDRVAGAVINVNGFIKQGEIVPQNFATNVSVENCNLINSGKFMWDYGYLWQIIVFPEDHDAIELAMAYKYFDTSLIFSGIRIPDAGDQILFDNADLATQGLPFIKEKQEICFFNDKLPANLKKGKRYYVVAATASSIKISETPDGKPISFNGNAGPRLKFINDVRKTFFQYAPVGTGPGKGCIDLVGCMNTQITGCRISALGDAMHVQKSYNNVFSNNHILGARMGAFFIADHCKNTTITGNTVDGTNGSRTMSIERSNENVTVIGNIFRNGGRGSWINQPKNIIIQSNVFVNNTTKAEHHPKRGRRDFKTGEWQNFPEIYFTTYQPNAQYGPVILKDNIFVPGPDAAGVIQFEKNGVDVRVEGNMFRGSTGVIMMDENDHTIKISNNEGAVIKKGPEYSKSLFKNE